MTDERLRRLEADLSKGPGDLDAFRAFIGEMTRLGLDLEGHEALARRLRASGLPHETKLEVLLEGFGIPFSRRVIRLARTSFPEYQFKVGPFSVGAQFRDGVLVELEAFGPAVEGREPLDAAWSHVSFRHVLRLLTDPTSVWPLDGRPEETRRALFVAECRALGLEILEERVRDAEYPRSEPGGFEFRRSGVEFSADWEGREEGDADGIVYVTVWPKFALERRGPADRVSSISLPDNPSDHRIFVPGDLVEAVDRCVATWNSEPQSTPGTFMSRLFEFGFQADREGPWFVAESDWRWKGRVRVHRERVEGEWGEFDPTPTPTIVLEDAGDGTVQARLAFPGWVTAVLGTDERAARYRTPRDLFLRLRELYA